MGGLVATLAVLDAGIAPDALILVAPLVDVDMSPAMKAQAFVGGALARAVPNARITPGVEPRRLSKDADAVREYVEDPRVFVGNLRVGLRYELLKGFVRARPRLSEVSTPLLVLHGTDDEATDPRASRRFFDAATSADKKFVSLEGACHLICHEAGASARVMHEVLAFVSSRAARGGATGRGVGTGGRQLRLHRGERGGGRVRGERGRYVGSRRGSFERSDEDGGGRVRGARIRREGGSTVSWLAGENEAVSCRLGFFIPTIRGFRDLSSLNDGPSERACEKIQTPSFAFFAGLTNPNRPDLESGIKSPIANRLASAT